MTQRSTPVTAPFNEGDIVRIRGEDHRGLHRVDNCEWFDRTNPGVPSYWLCACTQICHPIDWSKYEPGTTGIITGSYWRGSADRLEIVP